MVILKPIIAFLVLCAFTIAAALTVLSLGNKSPGCAEDEE